MGLHFWLIFCVLAVLGLRCGAQSLHCCSQAFSSCIARASPCCGFSGCGTQALVHVGFYSCGSWTQQLRHTGLVALKHAGSSSTRDRTHVPCTGRWILNHWTTREVPQLLLFMSCHSGSCLYHQYSINVAIFVITNVIIHLIIITDTSFFISFSSFSSFPFASFFIVIIIISGDFENHSPDDH